MSGEFKSLFFADGVDVTAAAPAPAADSVNEIITWGAGSYEDVDLTGKTETATLLDWSLKSLADDDEQIFAQFSHPGGSPDTSVRVTASLINGNQYRLLGK